jgi:hypothetical protein
MARGGCTSQENEGSVQLVEGAHFKKEVGMHSYKCSSSRNKAVLHCFEGRTAGFWTQKSRQRLGTIY